MNRLPRCSRCFRSLIRSAGMGLDDEAWHWAVRIRNGVPVALLCPDCQSAQENAEAEVNAATLDYGQDSVGRIVIWPRV